MKRFLNNLKLSAKLGLGFGICLLMSLAMGLIAMHQVGVICEATAASAHATKLLTGADKLEADILKQTRSLKTLLIVTSDADNAKYSAESRDLYDKVEADIDAMKNSVTTEASRKMAEDDAAIWKTFGPINEHVITLGLHNKSQEGDGYLMAKGAPLLEKLESSLAQFREKKEKDSDDAVKNSFAAGATANQVVIVCITLSIAAGIATAFVLTRLITSVVSTIKLKLESVTSNCATQLTAGLEAFALGDLTLAAEAVTQPINLDSKDEFGQIARTFDSMLAKFHGMIASYNTARESLSEVVIDLSKSSVKVASTSQSLAATAQETGAASSEIANGSYKLATTSSEVAEIVDRLLKQVKAVGTSSTDQQNLVHESSQVLAQASSGIEEVAAAAQTMAATANEGNRSVIETVEAMARVQETVATSSTKVQQLAQKGQQIGEIVSVIEGIAEQTNLLALNAAIEAARAGEQGRGFAVVAEEVRKLAEGASASTRQVSDLISSVMATVQETVTAIDETTAEAKIGTAQSEKAGLALKEILQNAELVAIQAESVANLTTNATSAMAAVANAAESNAELANEMASGADKVGGSIESVAAFTQQAAASAEELSASVEEVGASASQLAQMSEDLESIVATFKIAEEFGAKPTKLKVAA